MAVRGEVRLGAAGRQVRGRHPSYLLARPRRQVRLHVPTELGHRQRGTVPPRPHLPKRKSEHAERPADHWGVEPGGLLARSEPGGVRPHRGQQARHLKADGTRDRHRRPGQRGLPAWLPDLVRERRDRMATSVAQPRRNPLRFPGARRRPLRAGVAKLVRGTCPAES